MIQAYLALGSNLQNPIEQVQTALVELNAIPHTAVIKVSSFYVNPPIGIVDQPDFINAVALVETSLLPEDLLREMLNIELKHRRVRKERNGPRTLDIDLLLYGNKIIESDFLSVPHPALKDRHFVVYPLEEIAPDLILPCGTSIQTLYKNLSQIEFNYRLIEG